MEVDRDGTGKWSFHLGPVERWVVGVGGAAIVAAGFWMVGSVQTLITQQAVANAKLTDLTLQLGDMPEIRRQNVELKVRVDKHDDEIRELRQTRGLK